MSTQRRVPRSLNHLGTVPLERQSAVTFFVPGICFGEILRECCRLKYSIAAKILNPIPAEHLPFLSYATTSVLSENKDTIVWGE